jgi:hypothetical protein
MHEKKELVGIGGWLTLLAIGLIVGPLRLLGSQATYYSTVPSQLWTRFPLIIYGEVLLNTSLLLIWMCTAVLFFTKSSRFPSFFLFAYAAAVLLYPLDAALSAVGLSMYTGQPLSTFAEQMLDPKEVGQWIAILFSAMIWVPYVRLSKRVANTFSPREDVAAPYGEWSNADHDTFRRLLEQRQSFSPATRPL